MPGLLALGLFLQFCAVVVVFFRVGRRWLSHVGALFVFVSFVYHGLTEIIQMIFPDRNMYRTLSKQQDIDSWIIVISVAILIFASIYSLTLRPLSQEKYNQNKITLLLQKIPDWRLILIITLPGFWINLSGQDYGYWINNLFSYLTGFAILIASVSFLLKTKPTYVVPVLLVQSVAFALYGARIAVVLNAFVLLSVLMRMGVRIKFQQIAFIGLLVGIIILLISAARMVSGRLDQQEDEASTKARIGWLATGIQGIVNIDILMGQVIDDFVYRFDGNSMNAMVNQKLQQGRHPAGLQSLWNNFFLMVPSFIHPKKLETEKIFLFEEDYTVWHYDLPSGIDYIQGTWGALFSYYGTTGLLIVAGILGCLYAILDMWLHRKKSLLSLIMGIGFTYTALFMEFGILGYFGTFRSLLFLYLLLIMIFIIRCISRELVRYSKKRLHHLTPKIAEKTLPNYDS